MKVQEILARKGSAVIMVRPDQTIREAIMLLAKHDIGAVVVTDEANKLVGILSMRDVIREETECIATLDLSVHEVMTWEVITGTPDDELQAVVTVLLQNKIRHLPILAEGQLAGIISMGDVVRAQQGVL
ncbi:MAG: CBS domain-containing protein [Chloroflexi bacterium]|nr:CBS domain-containing protein [Chloroflexota bacterium]